MVRQAILLIFGGICGAGVMLWLGDAGSDASIRDRESPVSIGRAGQAAPMPNRDASAASVTSELIRLEQLARTAPAAALEEALRRPDAVDRRLAAERVATAWAASDPFAALAAAERLPGSVRTAVKAAIDEEWARVDAAGYLAFVAANPQYLEELTGRGHYQPEPILERSGGIRVLLASDPLSVVNLADNLSSRLGTTLKSLALSHYAERDPLAAIALAEQLRGEKRDAALAGVAAGYALANPEAALAWAQNLSPRTPAVLAAVLQGIAQEDVGRAIELGLEIRVSSAVMGNVPQFPPINAVILDAAEDSARAVLAADRLLGMENTARRDSLLNVLLSQWAERDPGSAIGWVRANAAALSEAALSGTAVAIASRDPALAARYTNQIPTALRETWIARVAQGYARADPAGALDWIAQYRGQAGYEVGMRLVIVNYAADDPAAAARLLDSASAELQLGAAATVADLWARRDGATASEWALRLSDENVRAAALPEAVGAWMSQSAQSAEDWTLRLPRGSDRDRALYVLLRGRAYTDRPRETYSSHPNEELLGQVSDPEMRREIEAWFENRGSPAL